MRKKTPYLTSEQLAGELEASQLQSVPTEKLCKMFLDIAHHLLGDSRYSRYPAEIKEDMCSAALLKCIKNIKNYKPQFKDKCFSYFTRCTEHAFWETLSKHYKQRNLVRDLSLEHADSIQQIDSKLAQKIRDSQIEIEHMKDKVTFKGNNQ